MKKYSAPIAEIVDLEIEDIILNSQTNGGANELPLVPMDIDLFKDTMISNIHGISTLLFEV